MIKKSPFIIAISGVGGAGKNAIMDVFKKYPDKFTFFVSYTDRPARADETPGETYHYISKEDFSESIKKNEFLEWEQVRGEYRYGRKKADFNEIIKSGKIPVMQIEVLGLQKFKKMYRTLSFFIAPPSLEEAINRMRKRNTDSEEAIKHRIERYHLEMSYKNKYDYVVINDDLERAQSEILGIVKNELKKKIIDLPKKIYLGLAAFLLIGVGFYFAYGYEAKQFTKEIPKQTQDTVVAGEPTNQEQQAVSADKTAVAVQALPTKEVKNKIAASPPKYTAPSSNIVEETKTNSNGTTTTTISTGGVTDSRDLARASSITTTVNTPYEITYRDETGAHPDLDKVLKDYLNSTLKWKNEISFMKEITLRDAGDTGWSGQFIGQYSVSADGKDIISAGGAIILNAYYYKDSAIFNEYMKLILSHEYGHHYTLYHKWVDWDLPAGVRFPDSYYSVRPLSKSATATDYSLGSTAMERWRNCEVEIIAEDYSYFYSGFGLHSMRQVFGYPSASTKIWLANIGSPSLKEAATDNPPALAITSPAPGVSLSGSIQFTANATDDIGIDKVSFYVGETLICDDTGAPYECTINTQSFPNGSYTLKAIASDGKSTVEKTVSVSFENTVTDSEKPTVSINNPAENPFNLTSDSLNIKIKASDNQAIDRIEFYFENLLQGSWKTDDLSLNTSFSQLSAGTYALKFKAYDKAGNFGEATLTVIKP